MHLHQAPLGLPHRIGKQGQILCQFADVAAHQTLYGKHRAFRLAGAQVAGFVPAQPAPLAPGEHRGHDGPGAGGSQGFRPMFPYRRGKGIGGAQVDSDDDFRLIHV